MSKFYYSHSIQRSYPLVHTVPKRRQKYKIKEHSKDDLSSYYAEKTGKSKDMKQRKFMKFQNFELEDGYYFS